MAMEIRRMPRPVCVCRETSGSISGLRRGVAARERYWLESAYVEALISSGMRKRRGVRGGVVQLWDLPNRMGHGGSFVGDGVAAGDVQCRRVRIRVRGFVLRVPQAWRHAQRRADRGGGVPGEDVRRPTLGGTSGRRLGQAAPGGAVPGGMSVPPASCRLFRGDYRLEAGATLRNTFQKLPAVRITGWKPDPRCRSRLTAPCFRGNGYALCQKKSTAMK